MSGLSLTPAEERALTSALNGPVLPRRARRTTPDATIPFERIVTYDASKEPVPQGVVPRVRAEALNRTLNVVLAALGLLITAPLLLVIGIIIKLTSRGPILYAQTRVGLDRRWRQTLAMHDRRVRDLGGAVFTIYKFRTMRVDAEAKSGAVWAKENDPRVTPLGRYLRVLRLDELPQLWNILRGDMNIVGPRPERPSIVARLQRDIPDYGSRHRVRPGLTGLAQINQQYDACLDDVRSKVSFDLDYLRRQSLLLDLRIMVRTVPAVLLKYRGW
ncbi:MAG TPA: sugar transferase [Gemmatimonadaceae bacterium]|nr:sugar transferase [Gemmatimonadaceae bacterium]